MKFEFRFPENFIFGTANSAFQSEGAQDRDGKSVDMMYYFAKEYAGKPVPGKVAGSSKDKSKSNYNMTCDLPDRGCFFYDNYEKYIEDMKKTGQNSYRMSISWSRILPNGIGEINQKGVDYYNRVIDKLIECGIEPFVDLYHWDMPMCLFDKGGFLNEDFPLWFEEYSKVCFAKFGDRVKMWSTFNESCVTVTTGYIRGRFPPYKESLKEGLLAAHHVILAHFRAVALYKKMNMGGKIGTVNAIIPIQPAYINEKDVGAADRQAAFRFDWWTQPMLKGSYPKEVLDECPAYKEAMPNNYQNDLDKYFVKMDFIGLNYYFPERTSYDENSLLKSIHVENFYSQKDQYFATYPAGLYDVVSYVARNYDNIEMYITENGLSTNNINDMNKECDDDDRIDYLREHLRMCSRCITAGYNLKGYYYWNDADSYEELTGYYYRFGLTWVDHKTGQTKWKKSRYYFSEVCKNRLVN